MDKKAELTAKVMIDNVTHSDLCSEWGLSIYIEYRGHRLLLDTGSTGSFAENAPAMGIDLAEVEYGVLSHAHYDHSDGMDRFFEQNNSAIFYIREGAGEDCYDRKPEGDKYIGIRAGLLEQYRDHIKMVSGDYELLPGVTLIPHKTPGLEQIGEKLHMYRRTKSGWKADDFSHEQSLVFDTAKGLVIFNSCSHGGADRIIEEAAAVFPDKKVYAILGGFHLYKSSEEEILQFADRIRQTGIQKVVTGHCTGDIACRLLKQELGEKMEEMYSGFMWSI